MKLRPSPALVVAVLALVVALAGTSYAAVQISSGQIKNNSVKGKDIKDKTLTGKDVRDGSLTGADVADSGLTGADVADGSLTSADIARTCPSTTVPALGVCIDKVSNGTMTDLATALSTCDARHARLMSWQEYRVLITKIPMTAWADGNSSNYELLDMPRVGGGSMAEPQAITFGGQIFAPATGSNLFFRCVTVP